jgi:galactose mutarotase-like enzyme
VTTPPSGTQHRIARGEQVAVVTEVGATVRSYDVGARPLLDGFPADQRPDGGRGQVLAPWPNRVRDGRYRFRDQDLQLGLTEADKGNAIHGLVRWVGWVVVSHTDDEVVMATTVWPQPGYPWLLRLRATYRLTDDRLEVALAARNDGEQPAPYGVGQHPYLAAPGVVDDAVLTLPADRRLLTDDRSIPVGEEAVDGTAYDFRAGRAIGDLRLDEAYVALQPGPDGQVRVHLEEAGSDHGVELWCEGATTKCLQVFSGDTLPDPTRRRRGLAVEPMSCPPDALASGVDLVVLSPGDEHVLRWGVRGW